MRCLYAVATIVALALAGSGLAQSSASHQVSVSIPTVLRLKIDHQTASDQARVPISVTVDGGRSTIDPASTSIEVLANTAWQLSVSFQSAEPSSGIALSWSAGGAHGVLRDTPRVVASGRATGGWHGIDVAYGVVNEPADGVYRGLIAYTLARP